MNKIIEVKYYKNFSKIKKIFSRNSYLKPFLDEISLIRHIYFINTQLINNIHICMSLNNKYIYPILVSMESILSNSNKEKTFISFHLLCSPDITEITISLLKSLMKHYSNFELIIYGMGNNFFYRNDKRLSQVTYYRLFIPIIINVEKIIYLDGDTLTLKDLTEMYNTPFNDNYILGILGIQAGGLDYLGIQSKIYINVGVILLNLKKIRKDNKTPLFLKMAKSKVILKHNDNTILNYVLYPKIGKLPTKFGIWNFGNKKDIEKYSNRLRIKINITEYEEALKDPGIIHNVLCWPKIWSIKSTYNRKATTCNIREKCKCTKYHNLWHFYARRTDYYREILKFSGFKK